MKRTNLLLVLGVLAMMVGVPGVGAQTEPIQDPPSLQTPLPSRPVPNPNQSGVIFFPQVGHTLRDSFLRYWQQYGGLAQFGYPLTEEFSERSATDGNDYIVQYFERARFELHPENQYPNSVLLGLLGKTLTADREKEQPFQRTAPMMNPVAQHSDATGHNMMPPFLTYWRNNGGLAIYGHPISEAFEEVSQSDGKKYMVQYFERNRFEFHPELPEKYQVSLGLLGREVLKKRGWVK